MSHDRRMFLKMSGAAGAGLALRGLVACKGDKAGELAEAAPAADAARQALTGRTEHLAQCPYCGVGCATVIQAENGRIVGMVPDQKSSVNAGVQCIKGLTAWEPTYQDRVTSCLIRRDMTDPLKGTISKTKGRFDAEVWREVTYAEASKVASEMVAGIAKKFGGNTIGL